MSKNKYYFKKPKTEIVKDVFRWLAVTGAVSIAASSPYFINNLMREFQGRKKYEKKNVYDVFYRLRKEGYLKIEKRGRRAYISLTEEGRKKAGRFQIDILE